MSWDDHFRAGRFADPPRAWAFRGQPQVFNNLAPSFSRAVAGTAYDAAQLIERELIRAFREHYVLLPDRSPDMPQPAEIGPGSDLRCMSVMQHYEVPTRLLDWTSDIWIALYFACATDPGNDAELWFYDRHILSLQECTSSEAIATIDSHVASNADPARLHERALRLIAELEPRITARMQRQLAHHTVTASPFDDHAQLLNDVAHKANAARSDSWYFRRFIVDKSCKTKMLTYLADHKNITAGTIFPDVVGLGRFLRWQFESLRTMLT
jgi:hypothetical protein